MYSCQKCDKNCLTNSDLTVHSEIIHLCSDVPTHYMISKLSLSLNTECDQKVCHKCHEKCPSNSKLTVHIEITHLIIYETLN